MNGINENEIEEKLKKDLPEPPFGFDERMEARVDSLVKQGRRRGLRISRRAVIALALVMALGISGIIGYAVNTPMAPSTQINAQLDREHVLTENTWYSHNTAGVIGVALRDRYPGLTDKWYHVVPVDLTRRGRQTLSLVASGMYYIGDVYVDVSADSVTVTYATYRGELYKEEECLQWFTDPADITREFLNNPVGAYEFGQKLSIKDDLKGADVALLFVCNRVTYRVPFDDQGHPLVRYYASINKWIDFRASLEPLFDRLDAQAERWKQEEEARRKAEEEAAAAAASTEPEPTAEAAK